MPYACMLPRCKHVDRTAQQKQCTHALMIRKHKRGYLCVECEGAGHQWVWCEHCCGCGKGVHGCSVASHWFERDSFDTGKRNHMQRHADIVENELPYLPTIRTLALPAVHIPLLLFPEPRQQKTVARRHRKRKAQASEQVYDWDGIPMPSGYESATSKQTTTRGSPESSSSPCVSPLLSYRDKSSSPRSVVTIASLLSPALPDSHFERAKPKFLGNANSETLHENNVVRTMHAGGTEESWSFCSPIPSDMGVANKCKGKRLACFRTVDLDDNLAVEALLHLSKAARRACN